MNAEESGWLSLFSDPIAFFTLVLAALTLALSVIAYLQWRDSRILQRAYISVEPRGVHPMALVRSVAHVSILNTGHLPARNVRWLIGVAFDKDGRRRDFKLDLSQLEGDNIVAPGLALTQGSEVFRFPGSSANDRAEHFLYVYGLVTYHDGFARDRKTFFCHRYNCANATIDPIDSNGFGIPAGDARSHRLGNSVG